MNIVGKKLRGFEHAKVGGNVYGRKEDAGPDGIGAGPAGVVADLPKQRLMAIRNPSISFIVF